MTAASSDHHASESRVPVRVRVRVRVRVKVRVREEFHFVTRVG